MESVKITIPGRPVPKKRPRTSTRGGKIHVYTPLKTSKYEKMIKYIALDASNGKSFFEDVEVNIKLFFKDRRFGDLDNYTKSILDGLQGIVFENDKQVAKLNIERYIDKEERAEVEIKEVS